MGMAASKTRPVNPLYATAREFAGAVYHHLTQAAPKSTPDEELTEVHYVLNQWLESIECSPASEPIPGFWASYKFGAFTAQVTAEFSAVNDTENTGCVNRASAQISLKHSSVSRTLTIADTRDLIIDATAAQRWASNLVDALTSARVGEFLMMRSSNTR